MTERLLFLSRKPLVGSLAYICLKILGVEFPRSVRFGPRIHLPHGAVGLVVHESVQMGDHVTLYQGVTLGRADTYSTGHGKAGGGIIIGSNVMISAGAKVLFKAGSNLTIGDGAIVGANAVLLKSVGENEIWAGIPARLIGSTGALKET